MPISMTVHALQACVDRDLARVEERLREVVSSEAGLLDEACKYLLNAGGKRIRPALVILASRLHGENPSVAAQVIDVATSVELIHMATLAHDDVVDDSPTRRGIHTIGRRWGNHVSVLSGDYLFAKGLSLLAGWELRDILALFIKTIVFMCEGEIDQASSLYNCAQAEADYVSRIEKKTAVFLGACCEVGAMMAQVPASEAEALGRYGKDLGMAFQIIDDILDLTADEKVVGKPVGRDISQGVFTLPVIHVLSQQEYRGKLCSAIENEDFGEADLTLIRNIIRESGALDYSYGGAVEFIRKAKAELSSLPGGPVIEALEGIADFVLTRKM